jgi:hypothetical protein
LRKAVEAAMAGKARKRRVDTEKKVEKKAAAAAAAREAAQKRELQHEAIMQKREAAKTRKQANQMMLLQIGECGGVADSSDRGVAVIQCCWEPT